MSSTAQIGVTGLAVMGRNLARNFARNGYTVALHNRTAARTRELVEQFGDEGDFIATESAEDFVAALERPRRLVVMVKAGKATDAVIAEFAPLLEPGDVIIDGGNAHFADTRRRERELRERDCTSSEPVSPAARRVRSTGRASCRAAAGSPTTHSARCWSRSPPRPRTARRA